MDNLCFILNGKKLYLEKSLIEDDIPIFFTCIDEDDNQYLALCSDMDEMKYYVVATTVRILYDMLKSDVPMKDVFLSQEKCWEIFSVDGEVEADIVSEVFTREIPSEDLPDDGAVFQLFCKDLKEYAESVKIKMLEKEKYKSFPNLTNDSLEDLHWDIEIACGFFKDITLNIEKRFTVDYEDLLIKYIESTRTELTKDYKKEVDCKRKERVLPDPQKYIKGKFSVSMKSARRSKAPFAA